jgi:hypothetical protein
MVFDKRKTYESYIKNASDSKLFRDVWAKTDTKSINVTKHGVQSCAVFVTNILKIFDLIEQCHATVDSTVTDLIKKGWYQVHRPRKGCILVWEDIPIADSIYKHIGFYIGNCKAVSNHSTPRTPVTHHWTYGTKHGKPKRKIIAMYWNHQLD